MRRSSPSWSPGVDPRSDASAASGRAPAGDPQPRGPARAPAAHSRGGSGWDKRRCARLEDYSLHVNVALDTLAREQLEHFFSVLLTCEIFASRKEIVLRLYAATGVSCRTVERSAVRSAVIAFRPNGVTW